jgi:two-component sensor histidine kinase
MLMSAELALAPNSLSADLAAEADHRIANHLAMLAGLLRMQSQGLGKKQKAMSGEEVRLVLEEFGGRLETVSKLHSLLASRPLGAPIDVANYLRNVAEGLVSSISTSDHMTIRYSFPAAYFLPPEKAVVLGLVVGELVTNAAKYAHPTGVAGVVKVGGSTSEDGTTSIEVSDDGVGLPENFDPCESCSLGFRMIRALTAQLGASITFENSGLGLICLLKMPSASPTLTVVS